MKKLSEVQVIKGALLMGQANELTIEAFTKALSLAYSQGVEEAIKTLKEADPLEAVCSWENSDDIAFAVQKYLVKVVRKLGAKNV